MNSINFDGSNKELRAPRGQEENCLPLPVYTNGNVCVSCWSFTDEEVEYIVKNRSMYFALWSGETQYPMLPLAQPLKFPLTSTPFTRYEFAWNHMYYVNLVEENELSAPIVELIVYVQGDVPCLNQIRYKDKMYGIVPGHEDQRHDPEYTIKQGDLYFRLPDEQEMKGVYAQTYNRLMAECTTEQQKLMLARQAEQIYYQLMFQPVLVERLSNNDEVIRFY